MSKKTAKRTSRRAGSPPPGPPPLNARQLLALCTRKQQAFILALLKDANRNQTTAYEVAGFKARGDSARANAAKCLAKDRVRAAYDALVKEMIEEEIVDAKVVLREMLAIATIDMRTFFDEHGNFKKIKDLTPQQGAALASFEVIIKNAEAGDGVTDTVHKFKCWDKTRVLEMLGKHKALFAEPVQKHEVDAEVTIRWE